MAILVMQALPPEVTLEQALAVSEEVGSATNPPKGGISHALIVDGGQVKAIDVWESQEARNAFVAERLTPAILKVAARFGRDPNQVPTPPEPQIFEAHDVMT